MSKWIAITVISVLGAGVIATGIFLWQQTGALGDARSEIADLEGNVATLEETQATLEGNVAILEGTKATLEGNVTTLEGNVATLETQLAESEATVSGLEDDLDDANTENERLSSDVSTQRNINSSLSAELTKIKFPRHFASVQELTDWLRDDDSDTRYANESIAQRCYILQISALRDGYLLPVRVNVEGTTTYLINVAYIGDEAFLVWLNDFIEFYDSVPPIPSYPLSP